jgi:hypothetical protein
VDVSSATWSQIKRGRFVAVPRDTETDALELEFYASGVEMRGSRRGHGDPSPPGSPNTKLEATSGQLNQRWVARLEGASLSSASVAVLASSIVGSRQTLTLTTGQSVRLSSCQCGVGRSQVVSRL